MEAWLSKMDNEWNPKVDHEDRELISVVLSENDGSVPAGLDYNAHTGESKDFLVMASYATPAISWPVDWCEKNKIHIRHTECRLSA